MPDVLTQFPKLHCKRCPHSWWPRSPERPIKCPKCGSPYWDRERIKRPASSNQSQ